MEQTIIVCLSGLKLQCSWRRKTSGNGMKGDKKERNMQIDMHVSQSGRQMGRQEDGGRGKH